MTHVRARITQRHTVTSTTKKHHALVRVRFHVSLFSLLIRWFFLFGSSLHTEQRLAFPTDPGIITVRVLLPTSIRLQHISSFIVGLRDDEFKARTAVNYMSAISWHLTYLKFLTHPDLDTADWTVPQLQLREIFCPELATEKKALERQLTESHQYLHQQIGVMSNEATQQTKARNSGEALQLRGRWVRFEWMIAMARAINEEGWGRMRCLKAMLASGESHATLCLVSLLVRPSIRPSVFFFFFSSSSHISRNNNIAATRLGTV
jgi:hypothetical protein